MERDAWSDLKTGLSGVELSRDKDKVIWCLERSGRFSVKSLYRFWSFGGVISSRNQKLWKSRIPLKVKVFVWLLYQDRLPTAVNLKTKNWKGNVNCSLCGVPEDTNHIFFNCVLAKFTWTCTKEFLNWDKIPESLEGFQMHWLDVRGANSYQIVIFNFAALVWTIWKVRNKMAIEKTFPNQPIEVIFKFVSCLQRWRVLIKKRGA